MTRRAFAVLAACLPLSWQVKLGAARIPPAHSTPSGYAWLHTTFDRQGSILSYLRQQFNASTRGTLTAPKEIVLGAQAFAQYEREWDEVRPPFVMVNLPAGASMYAFKGVPVFSADHHPLGWAAWYVGLLAPRKRPLGELR